MPIPDGLRWWAATPAGAAWLQRLPELVNACAERWDLTVGAPFEPASVSWVAPADLPDGSRAVLKINFPDTESEHEAAALEAWEGHGAVRLLAHDADRRALLLERCEPGEQLWAVDEAAANRIAVDVLRRLLRPAGAPFRTLADEAARWAEQLPVRWQRHGRPFARRLLDEAVALAAELAASQPEAVLCNQDFHGGNVLSAGDRWLAIDPKPLLAERAFSLVSLLRDRRPELLRSPDPRRVLHERLELLTDELGVDRERARGWGIVQALAWGMGDDGLHPDIVACAELLAARP